MTQDQCYQMDSAQNNYFNHYLFSAIEKSLQKHPNTFIFSNQTTNNKFILEHTTVFLQITASILPYATLTCIQNCKTKHFQHTRAEQLEWKVPCWILVYSLVSLASCLIMRQLDSSSPWDETFYGKDRGHRYSLSSTVCKNSDKWNRAALARSSILSAAL